MSKLKLTFAAGHYDRLAPLFDGRVVPEGIDLNAIALPVEETFYRQTKFAEFDVSEMSLSTYVLSLQQDPAPFVALPVFPSKYFRHQSMFVHRRNGIRAPKDLRGRIVGVPEYQITAAVWQRGILQDDHGVRPDEILWRQGGVEQPGRVEKMALDLPKEINLETIGPKDTLAAQLAEGKIDALFCAHEPKLFTTDKNIVRLFPDYIREEQDYFHRTGIFPIMHVVVVRRQVLHAHPWVARSLYKAFEDARRLAMEALWYRSALPVMLPWLAHHIEDTTKLMGADFWNYGLEANRETLDTFLRYSRSQGLAQKDLVAEELFAESTLTEFAI